ncbi:MAG: dihydrofolate reductase family protein, partial [Candidatus Phocaeicola faecipullorum]|nr:dihydrofolate reductase family protein [Candidatus Phocaeicola faecipullorum]
PQICTVLYDRKIQSLLVEGGTTLLQSFIDSELWDEIFVEHSEKVLYEGVKSPIIPKGTIFKTVFRDKICVSHYIH